MTINPVLQVHSGLRINPGQPVEQSPKYRVGRQFAVDTSHVLGFLCSPKRILVNDCGITAPRARNAATVWVSPDLATAECPDTRAISSCASRRLGA
jgi:hypothetical protein